MTEALRNKVASLYADVRFVVEKGPGTIVGEPMIAVLCNLITEAKDSGANTKICDGLLVATESAKKLTAADVLVIAGQLQSIVG